MKIKSTNIRTPIISFEWIDFMDTSVNDILLKNIVDHLKAEDNSKKMKVFPNWIVEHRISRAGYRMLQFPNFIDSYDKFNLYLWAHPEFLSLSSYTESWYFNYWWVFYLIVSKSNTNLNWEQDLVKDKISWIIPKI